MQIPETTPSVYIRLNGQLSQRVDAATWANIKAYMTYQDQDFLDDMDIFDVEPGWYVTNEEAVERLLSVPDPWKVAYRRQQAAQEREERQAREERERAEREVRIQHEKHTYATWKGQYLAGLEQFHDWFEGFPTLEWEEVAGWSSDVGWYDTGDRWSRSIWNGEIMYKCSYGNTTAYYTTRANAVKLARMRLEWSRQWYPTDIDMARRLLMTHDRGCIGDDSARIVVEEEGLQRYIDIARQEVWYLIARDHRTDDFWQTAEKYGLPYVELSRGKSVYDRGVTDTRRNAFEQRLKDHVQKTHHRYSGVSYLLEEDKWFVDEGHTSAPAVLAPDLSDLFPELKS